MKLHSSWVFASGAALLSLALGAGCDDTTTGTTVQLNLDRPADVAFACYGGLKLNGSSEIITSAQPLLSCDHRAQKLAPPDGQTGDLPEVVYFGLILQSGPGTVALARFPATAASTFDGDDVDILDADPLTPGKNSIAIGVSPVSIGTDKSGCFAVTANAGSRDLSLLRLDTALSLGGQAVVNRMKVKNGAAEVTAAPAAMMVEPGPQILDTGEVTADPQVLIGQRCGAQATGLAYVAYPECRAVAVVDLANGQIVKGVQFDAAGAASVVDPGAGWATACGGSAVMTAGPQPASLDLQYDLRAHAAAAPRRLAVGARNSNRVTVVDLDAAARPTATAQVSLFDATSSLGVVDIALSPHVGMGGNKGIVSDGDAPHFQFAYAVATDGTTRVASVLPGDLRECDTQLDPRYLSTKTAAELACLPMANVANPRRLGARGPGIPMPRDGISNAVRIMTIPQLSTEAGKCTATDGSCRVAGPTKLVGTFALIASTSGVTYVADIDDDDKADVEDTVQPLAFDLPTSMPHQLRDQIIDRGVRAVQTAEGGGEQRLCAATGPGVDDSGGARGGARLAGAVSVLGATNLVATAKLPILPVFQHSLCTGTDATLAVPELAFSADDAVRKSRFPDTQALAAVEDWRVIWEGSLSIDNLLSDNNGPPVRLGTLTSANQVLRLSDRSRPFCSAGVEPYDIVQLRGCDPASVTPQCPLGTTCYVHPDSTTGSGSCLPSKTADQLAETCRRFLVSARTYGVLDDPATADADDIKSNELRLVPRPRVLRSTPITGCTDTQQCTDLADYEATLAEEAHPSQSTLTARQQYVCEADASRKAVTTGKRCVMTCTRDADCSSGSVCVDGGSGGRCMESVLPPPACIAGAQRYELRASEALVVAGNQTGYVHPIIADANGRCVRDPNASPLQVARIPLSAPPCVGDGPTDLTPNPCSTTVSQAESQPRYLPGTCDAASPAAELVTRTGVPAIRYRGPGMTFHIVDPTFKGDARCRGDRLGFKVARQQEPLQIDGVPAVHAGYAMTFRIGGGYAPLPLRASAVMPVRVVKGPQQSIWIVDEGDFLSDTSLVPSTRGKVFRIESASITTTSVMQ